MSWTPLNNGIMYKLLGETINLIYWVPGTKTKEYNLHISCLSKYNTDLIGNYGIKKQILNEKDMLLIHEYLFLYCKDHNIFEAFNDNELTYYHES
jgi:hypothetical protein